MGFSPFASEEATKPHKWGSTRNKRFTDSGVNAWANGKEERSNAFDGIEQGVKSR